MDVLPHWNWSCRLSLLSHPVTAYWHWPISSSIDPNTPGARQVIHCITTLHLTGMTKPAKSPTGNARFEPKPAALGADTLPLTHHGGLTSWDWQSKVAHSHQKIRKLALPHCQHSHTQITPHCLLTETNQNNSCDTKDITHKMHLLLCKWQALHNAHTSS